MSVNGTTAAAHYDTADNFNVQVFASLQLALQSVHLFPSTAFTLCTPFHLRHSGTVARCLATNQLWFADLWLQTDRSCAACCMEIQRIPGRVTTLAATNSSSVALFGAVTRPAAGFGLLQPTRPAAVRLAATNTRPSCTVGRSKVTTGSSSKVTTGPALSRNELVSPRESRESKQIDRAKGRSESTIMTTWCCSAGQPVLGCVPSSVASLLLSPCLLRAGRILTRVCCRCLAHILSQSSREYWRSTR